MFNSFSFWFWRPIAEFLGNAVLMVIIVLLILGVLKFITRKR